MSALTSANGEFKSVVVYVMFFSFLNRLWKACSGAKCSRLSDLVKKSVSFFKKSQSKRCLSSERVEGDSTFSLGFS